MKISKLLSLVTLVESGAPMKKYPTFSEDVVETLSYLIHDKDHIFVIGKRNSDFDQVASQVRDVTTAPLYKGVSGEELQFILDNGKFRDYASFSEDRSVAQKFAGKDGGVIMLQPGATGVCYWELMIDIFTNLKETDAESYDSVDGDFMIDTLRKEKEWIFPFQMPVTCTNKDELIFASDLNENVLVVNGVLKAAVNPPNARGPAIMKSTDGNIATNIRPLHKVTKHGITALYVWPYVSGKSTMDLLTSIKGKGPHEVDRQNVNKFIHETVITHLQELKALNIEMVACPKSSSDLAERFALAIASALHLPEMSIGDIAKRTKFDLPDSKDEALKKITDEFIDVAEIQRQIKDEAAQAKMIADISKALYRQIEDHGQINAHKVYKQHSDFVKNFMSSELNGEHEYKFIDKNVLVVDDITSTNMTVADVARQIKDLGAKDVKALTLFGYQSTSAR